MLKFIRASIIYSIIVNPITCAFGVVATIYFHTPIAFLIIGFIYSTVITWTVGVYALKSIKSATKKQELKNIGIITLIGNNPLAGLLMLIIKDEQLACNDNNKRKDYNTNGVVINNQNEFDNPIREIQNGNLAEFNQINNLIESGNALTMNDDKKDVIA